MRISAGIGGAVRAGGGGGGMLGSAVASGVAGIAAAVASRAIQAVEDLAARQIPYADAAAKAAAESQKRVCSKGPWAVKTRLKA